MVLTGVRRCAFFWTYLLRQLPRYISTAGLVPINILLERRWDGNRMPPAGYLPNLCAALFSRVGGDRAPPVHRGPGPAVRHAAGCPTLPAAPPGARCLGCLRLLLLDRQIAPVQDQRRGNGAGPHRGMVLCHGMWSPRSTHRAPELAWADRTKDVAACVGPVDGVGRAIAWSQCFASCHWVPQIQAWYAFCTTDLNVGRAR